MEILFSGERMDELGLLFSDEFTFKGPLYEFSSGDAYIKSLEEAPPKEFQYSVLGEYEDEASACVVYQFTKPGLSVPMAQRFEIKDGRISSIQLIFDASKFT
jgi:hypothetical protein